MNETSSGSVNLWEFREYFDLPDDRSTTRLFRCFDEDRDNRVGFLELVVGLWTYCEKGSHETVLDALVRCTYAPDFDRGEHGPCA